MNSENLLNVLLLLRSQPKIIYCILFFSRCLFALFMKKEHSTLFNLVPFYIVHEFEYHYLRIRIFVLFCDVNYAIKYRDDYY